MLYRFFIIPLLSYSLIACASSGVKDMTAQQDFIQNMVGQHGFNNVDLTALLARAEIKADILEKISKPAESKAWSAYRPLFLTETRIASGVQFWKDNAAILSAVEQQSGVPAEIIVAIIGVETSFGKHTGNYRVLDALNTLAFAYPPRSTFFRSELEHFLLLCRDEQREPFSLLGSYAGAMGKPQFMPSSFREFAVDFDADGRRDIWQNNGDVIASVANYFVKHGWQRGQAVAYPAAFSGDAYMTVLNDDAKPNLTAAQLPALGVSVKPALAHEQALALHEFPLASGMEVWALLPNFYAITRYNHSPLYAMAVFQLSEAIAQQKPAIFK